MSGTIFQQVNYRLNDLLSDIALGSIGLPDIQRPFVWKNVKVRDLFDSMYRGYPVGYLLFWATLPSSYYRTNPKDIGTEQKQTAPNLLIVDGQQRLTALYSVMTGIPVVRSNYTEEKIRIAFNPVEERFEVTSAAMERDRVWIPDISVIWDESTSVFGLARDYLESLQAIREVDASEINAIESSFEKLRQLNAFPLTALVLAAETSEEDVSDVFVRINSMGKSLNQADFILTLMSVFWDEGRKALEHFCRDSRVPSKNRPSPFN